MYALELWVLLQTFNQYALENVYSTLRRHGIGDGGFCLDGMPHTQQLISGCPTLLPPAHSCPGTILPSAQ